MINLTFHPTFKILNLRVDPEALQVELTARRDGIIATIMEALGMGTLSTMVMDSHGFRKQATSFVGEERTYCPSGHISASVYLLNKPITLLLAAAGLMFFSLPSLLAGKEAVFVAFFFWAMALLLVLVYFFSSKKVTIGIITDAQTAEVFKLKVDEEQRAMLEQAMGVMEVLIRDSVAGRKGPAVPTPGPTAPAAGVRPTPSTVNCPTCRTALNAPGMRSGQQVRCPTCSQVFAVP